ncbi:terminase large subunit domain-containing protein [Anatilimnocola aggregata]|uniref:terminase large subunit domain-containing protein n=1 Tax=Anatilimnocola aggregata TaxID=2528021 RepID=UPI00192E3F32|nr:terminase family protein [Anatilimnocola aggregata]
MTEVVADPAAAAESVHSSQWIPHEPWPKQREFLNLACLEALYGGAAGGGKSEALLMAALEYVHVPGYAALILRRDTQRLNLAGGLIPRSHEWLAGKGATWNGAQKRWSFPTGAGPATLTFGYLRDRHDKYRYGSSEFQFIAFDELTEFPEEDYLFLFSRLRRTKGISAPLRVRSASNPGNIGHLWVRSRFISPAALQAARQPAPSDASTTFWQQGIAYVPARIGDNPALDEQEYRQSLLHLPPLARERLMNGDWTIQAQGLLKADWLRYFSAAETDQANETLNLHSPQRIVVGSVAASDCRRFVTVDPAGTSADRARERQGREASWTVAQVWDQPRGGLAPVLMLRYQARERVGFDGLCRLLRDIHRVWRPRELWIENEKLGQAAVDVLGKELPLRCIATQSRDKVARAAVLIDKLERGEIFLPQHEVTWRPQLESEWLAWTGDPYEPADQIDAAAYAAIVSARHQPGPVQFSTLVMPAAGLKW